MDPLSTFAIFASFVISPSLTKRPEWIRDGGLDATNKVVLVDKPNARSAFGSLTTTHLSIDSVQSDTEAKLWEIDYVTTDRRQGIVAEIQKYASFADDWDGEGSCAPYIASISASLNFLEMLPGGLPLPKPMVSSDGEIGFYWDLAQGFADISFDERGAASFFSRTHRGEESYQENIRLESLSSNWMFGNIGVLDKELLLAA